MSKIEDYRAILESLDYWDTFLMRESRLPGPRANLELAFAVALEGEEHRLLQYANEDRMKAPANSPQEFLGFCGVLGLGFLVARGEKSFLLDLRKMASDSRWRIREAVALGLQQYGHTNIAGLVETMESWIDGNLLERRAVVAAICEPGLLQDAKWAVRVFRILDRITCSITEETNRQINSFKVLRKTLGYGWSVAVAAQPDVGKLSMERWIRVKDKDIRWIMKQNLLQKRLSRIDENWVTSQLEILQMGLI